VEYNWEHNVILISKKKTFTEIIEQLIQTLNLKLIVPGNINLIDEESGFLVANLYTKSKLGEDALVNISIEKTQDKRIIGTAIIRSKVKDFTLFLGDKIKTLVK
jgi:coatomer subunit beta